MSFLKRLFSGGDATRPATEEIAGEPETYKDFSVTPTPLAEGGQFRLCALIEKSVGGEMRRHRLIRADMFPTRDAAEEAAIAKAKRMIDEQGDSLLD